MDLLQAVCDDLDKTRLELAETIKKLEDLCEAPESDKYKFYDRQRQGLLERENKLLEQRVQLWIMYGNGLGPRQDSVEKDDDVLLTTGDYTVLAIPLLILAIFFMNTFLAKSRVRFMEF